MVGASSMTRCRRLAPVAALLVVLFGGADVRASGESFEACVARKTAAGTDRAVATAECVSATNDNRAPAESASSDGDGTSVGALLAAGVAGVALGAGGVLVQRRQRAGATAVVAPPPAHAPPGMPPPGMAPAPTPAGDPRADGLVAALIDLGDRVNSTALRAEIVAALAAAGVQALDPPPGSPFDPSRMRGVGSIQAPSPAAVGTVATTDRVGYAAGARVLRLPDVIVHTAP